MNQDTTKEINFWDLYKAVMYRGEYISDNEYSITLLMNKNVNLTVHVLWKNDKDAGVLSMKLSSEGEQEFRLFEEEEIYGTYPWSATICYEYDMDLWNTIKIFLIDFIESSLKEPLSKNQLSKI